MKKYFVPALLFFSINSYAENTYDSYLVFHDNGPALKDVYVAEKATDFSQKTNLLHYAIKPPTPRVFKHKNVTIDLTSHVGYTIKTSGNKFVYKSDVAFGQKVLDRLYSKEIVHAIQPIGDYLLFREDEKITCFNLKQEKPCSKTITIIPPRPSANKNGAPPSINQSAFFYMDKEKNEIFQCGETVSFAIEKEKAVCTGKQYINLDTLM